MSAVAAAIVALAVATLAAAATATATATTTDTATAELVDRLLDVFVAGRVGSWFDGDVVGSYLLATGGPSALLASFHITWQVSHLPGVRSFDWPP